MKTKFNLIKVYVLALLLTTFGCSNDDDAANVNVVTLQDLEVTIDENPTNGQSLGTVQSDSNGALSFSIANQTPSGALNIDSSSGEVSVADASLFDFETNPIITASVSGNGATNTATVTINLTNIEVTLQDLTVSIDENPVNGQILGTIVSNGTGTSNYSLMNQTPNGALNIDVTSGELSVADASLFDFETNPVITASVSDGEASTAASVTINLTNINEVIIQTFDESIVENPSNGQVIGTVQSNATGNPNYSIVSQTPAGAISINPNTGEVTVADASLFDYEINQGIDAVIAADDATDSSDFEIVIDNVNELGDYNHGGIVFWIDPSDNNHGLVVAVSNQIFSGTWGCSGTNNGATGTAIGTGVTNTSAIVSSGCATSGSVIEMVSNLSLNGYNDWFVPSRDELVEIYNNIGVVNAATSANGGQVTYQFHWSSTEINTTAATLVNLTTGTIGGSGKNGNLYYTRPIRAF